MLPAGSLSRGPRAPPCQHGPSRLVVGPDQAKLRRSPILGRGRLVAPQQLRVRGNASLGQIALPALSHAPQVVIEENAELRRVALPALTEALSLTISHNHQLPSCEVVALFERITAAIEQQVDNDDDAVCAR